jgi:hypothetical protein
MSAPPTGIPEADWLSWPPKAKPFILAQQQEVEQLSGLAWHIRGITALAIDFVVLVALQRGLSRGRQHQQQQAVALRVQQPGLGAERFLPWRIPHAGAQLQGFFDQGVEHGKGACCSRLSLQAERQSPQLPGLRPAPGWGVHLQPATGRPSNPPVRAAEARLRLHVEKSSIEPRLGRRDRRQPARASW